jgi:hypothetical protein
MGWDASVLAGGASSWPALADLAPPARHDAPPAGGAAHNLSFLQPRHTGDLDAARRYLEWEVNLVHQIDARERAGFRIAKR